MTSKLLYLLGINLILLFIKVRGDLAGLRFYLYTKTNAQTPVEIKSSNTTNSPFVSGQPVKILCHGYTSSYTAQFPQDLKNVYLQLPTPSNINIIAVDWAQLCSATVGYTNAALNTQAVGKEIANLMKTLISTKKSQLSNFQFIGHSLGGQVGAFISQNLGNGQKIPRVTGLDPARPGFDPSTTPSNLRLDSTDAIFVDVIRTSAGVGSNSTTPDPPIGTVDFYPNGGIAQPGCTVSDQLFLNLCSHSRAYQYYQESVTTKVGFKSYKCKSYTEFTNKSCSRTNGVLLGEFVTTTISGSYYLDTNSFSPFAKG